MTFKKYRGQIYDVDLTPKEQKVVTEKINAQIIATHQQFTDDYDYMVLRMLRHYLGLGPKRLRIAYDILIKGNEELIKHYEMPDAGAYIARKEMNAIGVNIEEWRKERSDKK